MALLNVSCASTPPMIQPQVNSLVVAGKINYALQIMTEHESVYASHNRLLFLLDYGLVLHMAGQYRQSIDVFESAKKEIATLYTISVSNEASTWLVNDHQAPYRGEAFEHVLVHIFQALNYAFLHDYQESLVEVRALDVTLRQLKDVFDTGGRNIYQDDAFARLLMGLLYEYAQPGPAFDNAFIAYQKSVQAYETDYRIRYEVPLPHILKENILTVAAMMGVQDAQKFQEQFKQKPLMSWAEKSHKAEVVFVQYVGFAPIKHATEIPVLLPDGHFSKLAFPRYTERKYDAKPSVFKAVARSGDEWTTTAEVVEDIGALAFESLRTRKLQMMTKGVVRSAAKQMAVRGLEQSLSRRGKDIAAQSVTYVGNMVGWASEQADLRSWQTLPGEIHMARFILTPGDYDLYQGDRLLKSMRLGSGDRHFVMVRTSQ